MVKVVNKARPAGQSGEYRFFKNSDTGNEFKAKHEFKKNMRGDPTLAVSLSVTDAEGKAVVDSDGEVVLYWHTHTFTAVELTDPDFNAETRLGIILETAIEEKERELLARKNLDALAIKWSSSTPLAITKG